MPEPQLIAQLRMCLLCLLPACKLNLVAGIIVQMGMNIQPQLLVMAALVWKQFGHLLSPAMQERAVESIKAARMLA